MEANSAHLGFVLHDVARLLRKRFEQHAHDSGLTRSQWQVLAYLARNEGICQSALAERLEVEPITLSRSVGRLRALGLIERCSYPSDRRIWLLHLIPAARPKLARLRRAGDITRREALASISEVDRIHLLKTLQIVMSNLTAACDSPVEKRERAGSA